MNVALDSNILISDPWLSSARTRALLDFVSKTRSYIVLHKVVEHEVKARHKRVFATDAKNTYSALKNARRRGLVGLPPDLDHERVAQDTFEKWERNFHDVLGPNVVYRVGGSGHHHEEAIRRAIERVPPCSESGEGIRDAIIWLDLLEECRYPSKLGPLTFVSENTSDFAGADKLSLRAELEGDVQKYEAEITYCSSLQSFLKDHAEPVEHITKEWLIERVWFYDLEGELRNQIAYGAYDGAFRVSGIPGAEYYVPTGRPDIKSVETQITDFYVWPFDDDHIEVTLSVDARVEADIECVRPDAPPISSYGDEHFEIVSQYRNRTLPCYADVEFEIVADVEGDEISFRYGEGALSF